MPASPPRKTYAASSSESGDGAAISATSARTISADARVEQDREQQPARRVGHDVRQDGPVRGERQQEGRADDEHQPISSSTFVGARARGRNRHTQASRRPTTSAASEEPAAEPEHVRSRVAEAELVDRLDVGGRDLLAACRTIVLVLVASLTITFGMASAARSRACWVRSGAVTELLATTNAGR